MKRWEEFNNLCHEEKSVIQQRDEIIEAKRESGEILPETNVEAMKRAIEN